MREARIIDRTEHLNKDKSSKIKSHNEILDLLKEIESIEEIIKNRDKKDPSTDEFFLIKNDDVVKNPIEFEEELEFIEVNNISETSDVVSHELEFSEVITDTETFSEVQDGEIKNPYQEIENQKIIKNRPNLFQRIFKSKSSFENITEEDMNHNSINQNKSIRSTFELRVDDEGRLVGFNIKPVSESEDSRRIIARLLKVFSRKSKSEDSEEKSKIVGKITGIFSKLKGKKSEGSEGSKISNVLGKVKGIFSKSKD